MHPLHYNNRAMKLNDEQLHRYSRQLLLKSFGGEGQKKLLNSSVLVLGAGGLGSAALLYLAGCGVGKIGIVDFDKVEISNLPRQVIYDSKVVGRPKVELAKQKIQDINPDVQVKIFNEKFTDKNAQNIIGEFDVVLDGLDNFQDKFLLNDYAVKLNKSFVHAGVVGYEGQIFTVVPEKSACLRCVLPEIPQDAMQKCSEVGVLNTCVGIISMLQANEVLKLLVGIGDLYTNRILKFDALSGSFYEFKIKGKNKDCPACKKSFSVKW